MAFAQAVYQSQGLADRGHDVTLCLPYDSSLWELPEAAANPLWHRLPPSVAEHRAAVENLLPADFATPTVIHAFHNRAVKRVAWWGLFWRRRNLVCVAHRGVIFRPGNPLPYWSPAMKGLHRQFARLCQGHQLALPRTQNFLRAQWSSGF